MNVLNPDIHIIKPHFSGKLLISGDLEDNCILFRFLFDRPEMVHPLVISIEVLPLGSHDCYAEESGDAEKEMEVACNIPDFNNPVMKTRLIFPEFLLSKHRIKVMGMESQVSCNVMPLDSETHDV